MIVRCPQCQTPYRVDVERLRRGRGMLRCARCRHVFPVGNEPVARPAPADPPAPQRAAARLEVAVVGMEAGTARQRVGSVLTRLGVRMVHADDGPTALDGSRRARPRLIVLAHFLPGLTGPEVLAELQAEPALALASTLLIGGPGSHGRHAPHPALTWGSDAWLPEDTREADIEPVVRALLGLAEGRLSPLDEQAARARARVVVADMRLYLDEQLAEGRRTGTMPPRVNAYLAAARIDFLASQPGARLHEDALRAWDEEIVRALRERPAPA